MGIDIHAWIEYQRWPEHDKASEFATLTLVRNNVIAVTMGYPYNHTWEDLEPVVDPRGFPEDCDPEIVKRAAGEAPSWLTADELDEALTRAAPKLRDGVPAEYRAIVAAMRALGPSARLVFWFADY